MRISVLIAALAGLLVQAAYEPPATAAEAAGAQRVLGRVPAGTKPFNEHPGAIGEPRDPAKGRVSLNAVKPLNHGRTAHGSTAHPWDTNQDGTISQQEYVTGAFGKQNASPAPIPTTDARP
jgi:hypothetical protein